MSGRASEMGKTHILWSPESGRCGQCGLVHAHVRRFTSDGAQTMFCQGCWDGFMDECNVASGTWKTDVSRSWVADVDLSLEFEEQDGASQSAGRWD